MSRIRILVLTSSTGGGHDARAEAFAEWCFQLYRHDVEVRIEQMLEKSSVVNSAGVRFYNRIQRSAPWVHQWFYAFVELLSFVNSNSVTFGRKYYLDVLRTFQPHLIFSVHDCLNRGYFQLAREVLGAARVRCATYCSEFSGGWGYSRNWIEPTVDLYLSRTPTARDYAVKLGVPQDRTKVRGSLMHPRAHHEIITPEARQSYLFNELALDPDKLTIFLATGGNGANNHFELLPELLRYPDQVQAIVICGHDKIVYNELLQWRALHPEFGCYLEGFSDIVHVLMQVSDAIVTRGGTTTCAKALHFKCPIVFNAFGGIMPQEWLTWKFFRNGAECRKIESASDFAAIVKEWLTQPGTYQTAREKFLRLRYEEDPTKIIDELVDLAAGAAGTKPQRRAYYPVTGSSTAPF